MKITQLLRKLDDEEKTSSNHSIRIFDDYSGHILDGHGDKLFEWENKKEMNKVLTAEWNRLTKPKQKWEL